MTGLPKDLFLRRPYYFAIFASRVSKLELQWRDLSRAQSSTLAGQGAARSSGDVGLVSLLLTVDLHLQARAAQLVEVHFMIVRLL